MLSSSPESHRGYYMICFILSPDALLGQDSFPIFLLSWPLLFREVPVRCFWQCPSAGTCVVPSSWLGWDSVFGEEDHRGTCRSPHTGSRLSTMNKTPPFMLALATWLSSVFQVSISSGFILESNADLQWMFGYQVFIAQLIKY